jgi:predicted metal-dependent enzyme (double-stranded beta helix superfamily)
MFDIDGFVEACLAAKSDSEKAMREVVRAAVGEPGNLMAALGEPAEAGIETLHRSDDLTILNVVWAPLMTVRPHDHRMWAVIGIYAARTMFSGAGYRAESKRRVPDRCAKAMRCRSGATSCIR